MKRILAAYRVEIEKAVKHRFTYIGPVIVILFLLGAPLLRPIVRDGVSDYDYLAYITPMALNLLGLFLVVLYSATLISRETALGTLRMLLVRPIHRWELLGAKFLMACTYVILLNLVVITMTWASVLLLGDTNGITFGGELIHAHSDIMKTYGLCLLTSMAPQMAAAAYALMFSVLLRSTAAAITASMGVWLLVDLLKHPLHVASFLFTSYAETPWQVLFDQCNGMLANWWQIAIPCVGVSLFYTLLFLGISVFVFVRRDFRS